MVRILSLRSFTLISRCFWLSAVAGTAGFAADAGPGIVFTSGSDAGERLNVDETFTLSLAAGTYAVSDFSYFSTANAGGAVPFLATSSAANTYDLLWIGSVLAGTQDSTMTTDPAGMFTLAAPSTVYGGFYTELGGRVAFGQVAGQFTDHNGVVTIPRGGMPISGFSNPGLNRTYSFKIGVEASPMLLAGPGLLSNTRFDDGERLNIDQAHPLTLSAGLYEVDDFSFLSTAAVGTVTPFLARLTGTDSYETVWVGGGVGATLGGVGVNPAGGFSLAGPETLYAGFYTADGGRVGFTEGPGRPPGFGISEHDNSFAGPTGAGQAVGGFSNPNLERTYSFSVGVTAVPEPGSVALLGLGGLFMARRRRVRG